MLNRMKYFPPIIKLLKANLSKELYKRERHRSQLPNIFDNQKSRRGTLECSSVILSLGREDPLEERMTTHSSPLAWRIPWAEEPGRLQSMGSQRVGRD